MGERVGCCRPRKGLPVHEQCREPEALRAELATGNHDRLGVRRNVEYVLGRPRSSTVMPEEPAASPDHAGDVLGEVLLVESRMEQPPQPEGLPVTGGGALLDLHSHAVDQALHPRPGPATPSCAWPGRTGSTRIPRGPSARRHDGATAG